MPPRRIAVRGIAFAVAFCAGVVFGQPKPAVSSASGVHEFPVKMRQNVVAGKTPVGTKVEANLQIATLVGRTVIPVAAIFSGTVIQSAAKSATDPSRLAIRMDSVRWKTGSTAIKVYLTAWYYPIRMATDEVSLDQPPPTAATIPRRRRAAGPYDSNQAASGPFPGSPAPSGADAPPVATANLSDNRALMKDVESTRHGDGAVALSSKRVNIKLDKSTTYVLAMGELTR